MNCLRKIPWAISLFVVPSIGAFWLVAQEGSPEIGLDAEDQDRDGMLDHVERTHFKNLKQTPDGDPDFDRITTQDELLAGSNPARYNPWIKGESGIAYMEQYHSAEWLPVKFSGVYKDPVVIANTAYSNARNHGYTRIRKVGKTGFEVCLEAIDGVVPIKGKKRLIPISWLVVESGNHRLPGGFRFRAGNAEMIEDAVRIQLGKAFPSMPCLFAQVISDDGAPGDTGIGVEYSASGVKFKREVKGDPYRFGWIAWKTGRGELLSGGFDATRYEEFAKDRSAGMRMGDDFSPKTSFTMFASTSSTSIESPPLFRSKPAKRGKRVWISLPNNTFPEGLKEVCFLTMRPGIFGARRQWADKNSDGLPDRFQRQKELVDDELKPLVDNAGFNGDPDGDGISSGLEYLLYDSDPLVEGGIKGYWNWEVWNRIKGVDLSLLTNNERFLKGEPDRSELVNRSETIVNLTKGYGSRMRGTMVIQKAGRYRFYLSADDAGELWISTNETKFSKRKVAEVGPATGAVSGGTKEHRNWHVFASQRSGWFHLEKGQELYVEVLHIEDHGKDHASVGFQRWGKQKVTLVPTTWLRSYRPDPNDQDDDALPDLWESRYGLDPNDNGLVSKREGERNDYDGDGLTNHEEYLLGLDPTRTDSDGDGISDAEEIRNGGDVSASEYIVGNVIDTQRGNRYTDSQGTVVDAGRDGEVRALSRRGLIEYTFSVPRDGIWEYQVTGRAHGEIREIERLRLLISIDDDQVASHELVSTGGGADTIVGLTPWLRAGQYRLGVFHDNVLARRQLQIDSIAVAEPSGVDRDGDGVVDAVSDALSQNKVRFPKSSMVSPLFVEGRVRLPGYLTFSLDGSPQADVTEWGDGRWFTNIALKTSDPVRPEAVFENGAKTVAQNITWQRTNLLAGGDLTLRVGDQLRLGAWPVDGARIKSALFTIDVNDKTWRRDRKGNQAPIYTFKKAGSFAIRAQWRHQDRVEENLLSVKVVTASFPEEKVVALNRLYKWKLPNVSADLKLNTGSDIYIASDKPRQGGKERVLRLAATTRGRRTIVARTGPRGPIVAHGTIYGSEVAGASQTGDARFVRTYADGERLVTSSIVNAGLPPGGYIEVKIFVAGVTFADGTLSKVLRAGDFDETGVAYLNFNYPNGQKTSICHRIYVYDANDTLVSSK